ncbi:MAG: CsgG/HfaB family protein, partial [Spirochaetia bacterium]|nr:CsgG/HfaB family protein [Spirochaetia bacterium]
GDYGFYTEASNESLDSSVSKLKGEKNLRLAVLDFSDRAGNPTMYGSVIADNLIEKLSKVKHIQLMERSRMKLLLDEKSLEESGALSKNDIIQMGQILPVDLIALGSYFRQAKGIKVNGRFIDVETGEIKGTFSYLIPQPKIKPFKQTSTRKKDCSVYEKEIYSALKDLRTPQMINHAVEKAIRIPYSAECAYIHYKVMYTFRMGSVYPELYVNFLRDSLIAIQDPDEVDRKREVLYYFKSDNHIDDQEWNAGLIVLKYAKYRNARMFISTLLNSRKERPILVESRIDELFTLSEQGVFGKPLTITKSDMFFAINRSFGGYRDDISYRYRIFLYKNYIHNVVNIDREYSRLIAKLTDLMRDSKKIEDTDQIMKYSLVIAKKIDPESWSKHEENEIWSLLHSADFLGQKQRNESKYSYVFDELKPSICISLSNARNNYEGKQRVKMAMRHSISCGEKSNAEELVKVLESKTASIQKKEEASAMLAGMSRPVLSAKRIAFEYLGPRGNDPDLSKVRKNCIQILMKIDKSDPAFIKKLIQLFSSRNLTSTIHTTLKEIDLSASLPIIRKTLRTDKDRNRLLNLMYFLRSMGKRAKPALPELKYLKTNNRDNYVRRIAGDTIKTVDVPF